MTRNDKVTKIIKKRIQKAGFSYIKLYREPRVNSGIDGRSIKFYGIRPNRQRVNKTKMAKLQKKVNKRIEKFGVELCIVVNLYVFSLNVRRINP